jgi:uncharacterized repeat protein (TIGR03803 family)
MRNNKIIILSWTKSFRTSAAFILTTLMLMAAAGTTLATAQTYTDLYSFDHGHGRYPNGVLAEGRDGNLYGTTPMGSNKYDVGVVFTITVDGILNVLYRFDVVHGYFPEGGLSLGKDGKFYGSTLGGGANNQGTIFRTTKSRGLTLLYSFKGATDGSDPEAPPIQGTDGSFYGTTGAGTAYKITSAGSFTPLGSLPGQSRAPLLQGTDGNFYGTTLNAVFKMTPKGIVTTLYTFDGTHGDSPYAPVLQASDGNFYGTTAWGGRYGQGVVFKLTRQGTITVLHNFPDPNYPKDGSQPHAGLVQATDGNLYGVATYGGAGGGGVIFQITPAGIYSILHNFDDARGGGVRPESTPMQHTNGKIYGMTSHGGGAREGVVYSLDVGLGPFFSLVSTSGKVGKTIEVLGQGFTGTSAVSFNGTSATFKAVSDTYLTTTVPSGATTGFVTVTTPSGKLTSNKQFRVTPVVLNFSPASGPVGTPVTLTGNSLTQTTKVAFGGVQTTNFSIDSDAQVTATVPTGAKTGLIAITTAGGTARSTGSFTVTP